MLLRSSEVNEGQSEVSHLTSNYVLRTNEVIDTKNDARFGKKWVNIGELNIGGGIVKLKMWPLLFFDAVPFNGITRITRRKMERKFKMEER